MMESKGITLKDMLTRVKDDNLPLVKNRYDIHNLKFNPFPKSGTANLQTPPEHLRRMTPVNVQLENEIEEYLVSTLFAESYNKADKYMGATIIGNYGSGKTQMLMHVKHLLNLVASDTEYHQNPFAIYIDNPGIKLSELIGKIVSEIGEENVRKFIWNKVIAQLYNSKEVLNEKFPIYDDLFRDKSANPWDETNKVNYKKFINAWLVNFPTKQKRVIFEEEFGKIAHRLIYLETSDNTVTKYFFNLLIDEFGDKGVWDSLTKGEMKNLAGKESSIIKFIINLLYEEGFTHVYVLVDEFEDITRGRLTKQQADNYLYSLRTLIDIQRNWTIMFAMTQEAFDSLEETSPPLADRISSRKIYIRELSVNETRDIIANYLSIAREDEAISDDIKPFSEDVVAALQSKFRGNTRMILSACFKLIEYAISQRITEIKPDSLNNI